jgi:arylsulfatase A-like enzyme
MSLRAVLAVPSRSARRLMPAMAVAALLVACSFSGSDDQAAAPTEQPLPPTPELADLTEIHPSGPPPKRPNILLIMTDDMRADELRWMPQTRRLLGEHGVRFVNGFAPHPVCCPSRASTLTGQYTHNHKVYAVQEPWGFHSFNDQETVATALQRSGYDTLFLGKYLNGYGIQPPPDNSATNSTRYVPPGWSEWRGSIGGGLDQTDPLAGGTYRYFDMTLNVNGTLVPNTRRYSTTVLGDNTVDLIHDWAPKPKPFFLWVNYVAPHKGVPYEFDDPDPVATNAGNESRLDTPAVLKRVRDEFDGLIRPKRLEQVAERDVADKPDFIQRRPPLNDEQWAAITESARQRAESLKLVDGQVLRTVRALRASGELDDTIIVFTSDNGYFLGEHRLGQGKILPYDPSLRVPMLIRGPELPRGQVRRDPFLIIDLAPTFMAAAGAHPRIQVDGQSMLPIARNGDRGWRRPVLTETGPREVKVMINGKQTIQLLPKGYEDPRFSVGLRTSRYLYVEHATGERELYDLLRDPDQMNSRAGWPAYRSVQQQLASVLHRIRDCAGPDCRVALPKSLWGPALVGPGVNPTPGGPPPGR